MLLMEYLSAEQETTWHMLTRLMLGCEIHLPEDLIMGRPPDDELPSVSTGYAGVLQERLTKDHQQSRSTLSLQGSQ